MNKTATKLTTVPPAMTTPAQLERLGEHLRKLRLLKSGERLEALLQQAAAQEQPYADFLEQVLGEEARSSLQIGERYRQVIVAAEDISHIVRVGLGAPIDQVLQRGRDEQAAVVLDRASVTLRLVR